MGVEINLGSAAIYYENSGNILNKWLKVSVQTLYRLELTTVWL